MASSQPDRAVAEPATDFAIAVRTPEFEAWLADARSGKDRWRALELAPRLPSHVGNPVARDDPTSVLTDTVTVVLCRKPSSWLGSSIF